MEKYQIEPKELFQTNNVNPKTGLSSEEVLEKQRAEGLNELAEKKKKSLFVMFLEQFKDFLVIILLIAAAISIVTGILSDEGIVDGIIILAIVILNAVLGVSQEQKATNALAALKKMSSPHAKVLRNGKTLEIATSQIVRGDIVLLETGDLVPADLRLFDTTNLQIEEAALTGES
ncbi:MAG TPA: ATPase, partial [Acholeplasmatales bacterium]|nr:ATPase [Acholeplasmatales bacterium]